MDLCAETGLTPRLATDRLVLRPLEAEDVPAIAAIVSDWQVARWLTALPWPYALSDADWFVRDGQGDGRHWAITEGGPLLGLISLHPDLGYWLSRPAHGRGLMTEAARAVVAWHFGRSDAPVISGHHDGNAASRAVLLKLGFVDTHADTAHARPLGRDVSIRRMRLDRAAWEAAHV